jgi:hypothetical protein
MAEEAIDRGAQLLESKEWQSASQAEREKIFARKVAKDPDYANQPADVQELIYKRFFPSQAPATKEAPAESQTQEMPSEYQEIDRTSEYPELKAPPASSKTKDDETKKTQPPLRKDTGAFYGAGAGLALGTLLQKYFAAPDKLQRDLYEKAIKNALAESGIDVAGFKGSDLIAEARRFVSQQPLAAEEKLAGLKTQAEELRALQPSMSTGFPSPLDQPTGRVEPTLRASGPRREGASAIENYMRAMAGAEHQVPDVIAARATDMTKTSPTGATKLLQEDVAAQKKIAGMGAGDYQLAGKGPGQLMLPPGVGAEKMTREAQVAREALAIILPQISALESQIARLQAKGQDVSNLIAQLEELRRAEGSARQLTKSFRIPPEAGLGKVSQLGTKARPTTAPSAAVTALGHTLGGVGLGLNVATALDESEDPISRTLAGVSGAFDFASLMPPVGPGAVVKGAGILGGLGMIPVQAGYEYLSPETKEKIRKGLRIPFKSVMEKK